MRRVAARSARSTVSIDDLVERRAAAASASTSPVVHVQGPIELRISGTGRVSVTAIVPRELDVLWCYPVQGGIALVTRVVPQRPRVRVRTTAMRRREIVLTGKDVRALLDTAGLLPRRRESIGIDVYVVTSDARLDRIECYRRGRRRGIGLT